MLTNNIWYERTAGHVTSTELAEHLSREHLGQTRTVSGFAALDEATPDDLAFCRKGYEQMLEESNAGVIITSTTPKTINEKGIIPSLTPQADFVAAIHDFFVEMKTAESIHHSAIIADSADIGTNCVIENGVAIGPDVSIGNNCVLGPGVTIGEGVSIGNNCVIGTGTSIGQPGFGYQMTFDNRVMNKIHDGTVVLGDNVHLGANCSVDRGTFNETRIETGSKLHNLCNIAHNVTIGPRNRASPCCHLAGGSSTGEAVRLHPHAVVGDHVAIGDSSEVGANSTVLDDVPDQTLVVGSPAEPIEQT